MAKRRSSLRTVWTPNTEGIFLGLNERVYHASPGVSRTMLDKLDPTPDGLPAYLEEPWEPKPWKTIGTAVHSLVLEPSKPLTHLVLQPKELWSDEDNKMVPWSGEGNRPKVRAAWKKAQESIGRFLVTQNEHDIITACAESIANNKEQEVRDMLAAVFIKGQSEVSCYRRFEVGDQEILLRCRIDWMPDDEDYILDIKTVGDGGTQVRAFASVIEQNIIQPIHYATIWESLGDRRPHWRYLGVEKKAPWRVRLFTPGPNALRFGRLEWIRRLNLYCECVSTGRWSGWPAKVIEVDLPSYTVNRMEEQFG